MLFGVEIDVLILNAEDPILCQGKWSQPAARAFSSSPFIANEPHSDDRYRLKIRVAFNPPGGLITVDHRHLNVHQDEVGPVGFGLGDTGFPIRGLDDGVTGASEEVAKHATQVFLVVDDEDALAHGALL
jgi:hypothetical protein